MGTSSVVHYECQPVYETSYRRGEGQSIAEVVVDSVAAVEECNPTALPTLQRTIDVDALNRLFGDPGTEPSNSPRWLRFRYADWDVVVCGDGSLFVCDPAADPDPEPGRLYSD